MTLKMMTPRLRQFALICHVAASVGWLGAVAAFLALAILGIANAGIERVQAAYISMESIGWLVIVPLSVASLVTGIIQALGTPWGLFRHYWVLTKLGITVGASVLLLVHMRIVSTLAAAAVEGRLAADHHLREPRMQLIADSGGAVLVLLLAVMLSIYKPPNRGRWLYALGAAITALVVAVIMRHLSGGMPSH
jgi:hypothetical protein